MAPLREQIAGPRNFPRDGAVFFRNMKKIVALIDAGPMPGPEEGELRDNRNDDHREGALGLLGCLPAHFRLDEPVRNEAFRSAKHHHIGSLDGYD